MLQFKDLLTQILLRKNQVDVPILKTRLIKLAYLVEVEYYRSFRERISNTDWVYYKYGPYVYGYDEVLKENEFYYKPDINDDDFAIIELKDPTQQQAVSFQMKLAIDRVVRKYGSLELNKLLDLVYFNTEPMAYVESIRDTLDFSLILPKNEYSDVSKVIPDKNLLSVKQFIVCRREHVRQL